MNAPLAAASVRYLDAFARLAPGLPGATIPWLRQARAEAMQRFARAGLPGRHDEDWKYTPLAAIENGLFDLAAPPAGPDISALAEAAALPGCHRLVFVDGHYEPALSLPGLPVPGVILESLASTLARAPAAVREVFAAAHHHTVFADLNLAFMSDGAFLYLPPGRALLMPLHLLFISRQPRLAQQTRVVVLAGEGSSGSIIEHHLGHPESAGFNNVAANLLLAPAARIEHHRLVEDSPHALHIASLNVSQAAASQFVASAWSFGGQLIRVDLAVDLAGRDARCELLGLYLADQRQHIEHHLRLDHRLPGGHSHVFYKGIANAQAHTVFNGRVVVHPEAGQSHASQENHNLLLSPLAEVDSKPQLEIWADDVQCSHGATVGPLDEEQVFYLRARGLDAALARALLVRGFAGEAVDRLALPVLRERVTRAAADKLAAH